MGRYLAIYRCNDKPQRQTPTIDVMGKVWGDKSHNSATGKKQTGPTREKIGVGPAQITDSKVSSGPVCYDDGQKCLVCYNCVQRGDERNSTESCTNTETQEHKTDGDIAPVLLFFFYNSQKRLQIFKTLKKKLEK